MGQVKDDCGVFNIPLLEMSDSCILSLTLVGSVIAQPIEGGGIVSVSSLFHVLGTGGFCFLSLGIFVLATHSLFCDKTQVAPLLERN